MKFMRSLRLTAVELLAAPALARSVHAAQPGGGPIPSVSEPETFILLGAGLVIAAVLLQRCRKKST